MSSRPTDARQVGPSPRAQRHAPEHGDTPPQHSHLSSPVLTVNFWYDMEYDIKYNYFQLLESLSEATSAAGPLGTPPATL